MKYTLEDLQNDKPIPESLTDEAYALMGEDGVHKDDMPDFLPDYVVRILGKGPWATIVDAGIDADIEHLPEEEVDKMLRSQGFNPEEIATSILNRIKHLCR